MLLLLLFCGGAAGSAFAYSRWGPQTRTEWIRKPSKSDRERDPYIVDDDEHQICECCSFPVLDERDEYPDDGEWCNCDEPTVNDDATLDQ